MGELNLLLSNYSVNDVIIIIAAVLLIVIAILRGWDFLWGKIKTYLGMKNEETDWKENIGNQLGNISSEVKEVKHTVDNIQTEANKRTERLEKVEKYVKADYEREEEIISQHNMMKEMCKRVQARLQDDTRWSFRDAYNYYYLKEHKIDQNSMEALEKKYKHYKDAGGNSFVDNIIEKLRTLPIVETMNDSFPKGE